MLKYLLGSDNINMVGSELRQEGLVKIVANQKAQHCLRMLTASQF